MGCWRVVLCQGSAGVEGVVAALQCMRWCHPPVYRLKMMSCEYEV